MVKPITLYSAAAGLNTVLDPQRLSQGSKDNPARIELAQAVNVSIDDRGLLTTREGSVMAEAGSFHSLFCSGGDAFVIQERTSDAAIMRVSADLSLTGIRSGLSKNERMAWGQEGGDTFYGNGIQNGYIRDGVSSNWPAGTYTGPDADIQFESVAPIANHMTFIQGGKCVLARGKGAYLNHQPFQYGLFSLARGYIGFASNVRMLCSVQMGFFASDESNTWFFRQLESGWYAYRQELVDAAPAIEWSLAHDKISLRDIGIDANGFCRSWASKNGICLGLDDGSLIHLTKHTINYPQDKETGASLVKGTTIINTAS
jgi:hypothetical protein